MRCWSDEEICRGMRDPRRRELAFRQVHAQFGPRLLGFLAKMCRGDRDRAEDLLGRTLYKAFLGLARMERDCRSLSAWLYTVAARVALDEFARADRQDPTRHWVPLDEEWIQGTIPDPPGRRAAQEAIDLAVEEVLARLDAEDPRYRTLLEMEHIGICDRGEIAEATGIARKQLSQYLKRARQRFVQLAREYPILAAMETAKGA
jgi:RNA polymerase sigma factor (sigma-70 family)